MWKCPQNNIYTMCNCSSLRVSQIEVGPRANGVANPSTYPASTLPYKGLKSDMRNCNFWVYQIFAPIPPPYPYVQLRNISFSSLFTHFLHLPFCLWSCVTIKRCNTVCSLSLNSRFLSTTWTLTAQKVNLTAKLDWQVDFPFSSSHAYLSSSACV